MEPDTSQDSVRPTTSAEHLSPAKSKKVTLRQFDPASGDWVNISATDNGDGSFGLAMGGLSPGISYDYLDVQQTSGTVETYVFKLGGSGGTTVRTVVVTYTSTAKTDIDTVAWS